MRFVPACFLLLVTAALAGCTSSGVSASDEADTTASASPESTATVSGTNPLELLGTWHISEASGEEPGTVVRIEPGDFQLSRNCGDVEGSWVANDTEFRAAVTGWAQTCNPPAPTTWLEDAASYELSAGSLTLYSDDGGSLAVLRVDGALAPEEWVRDRFAGIVSWPEELEPAEPAGLLGVWVPPGDFATDPHIIFSEAGRWSGTDGCNGASGRWILSPGGSFASTSGPTTLIGCDGAPVPTWVMTARGAGMDGDELVLLDMDGQELGRLVRR